MPANQVLLIVVAALVVLVVAALWFRSARRPATIEKEIAAARRSGGPVLEERLERSRSALGGALRTVFGRSRLDDGFWEGLEEALVGADVGVPAATAIVGRVRAAGPNDTDQARRLLRQEVLAALSGGERSLQLAGRPSVMMVVGVNGTGKTTSIAKLAKRYVDAGTTTLLGAADTFRAAADTQLRTWADRVGVEVVSGQAGADPASVAYDALAAARARGRDLVIVDTAGRLHSKKDLMAELAKIRRVLERETGNIDEVLLVLDATAGQNGLAQARTFAETAGLTGIVLSKLDGTAKGGVVVAIEQELGVPVKFIGVGEGMDDLIPFEPEAFVDALLGAG